MGNAQDAELFKPSKDKTWKAYCAIDVGAVSCGYAYSFDGVKHIWMNKNWAESLGYFSQRAPSAIMYDKSGNLDAFGFEACEKYMSMSKEEVQHVTFAYDGLLNVTSRDIGLETYRKAEDTGSDYTDDSDDNQSTHAATASARKEKPSKFFVPKPVLKRRCHIALLLAKHCKDEIEAKYKHYKETPDEFEWIILVPMTWEIKQKQYFRNSVETEFSNHFIREFASERYKLKLVTSTEALWFASREQETFKNIFKKDSKKEEKAIVVIHSGGTMTEISIHKKATGAHPVDIVSLPIGGRYANNLFEEHLSTSLTDEKSEFVQKCKEEHTVAWLDLVLKFEAARKAVRYTVESNVSIDINYGFSEAYNKITGNKLSEVMPGREDKDIMQIILSKTGKLILNGKVTMNICNNVMQLIYQELDKIMKKNKLRYRGILLTGGFAESTFVREFLCSKQETKEMMPIQMFTPENSTSLLTVGAIASAKQKHELGHTIAVIYNAIHQEKEGVLSKIKGQNTPNKKLIGKLFPLLVKGQTIDVGKYYEFGPLHTVPTDHEGCICAEVVYIPESMEIIKTTEYYSPEWYKDKVTIDTLKIHVPQNDHGFLHNLNFDVVCDFYEFNITMTLPTSKPRKTVTHKCEYMPPKWMKREKQNVKPPKHKEQKQRQPQEGVLLEEDGSKQNAQIPKYRVTDSYKKATAQSYQ